MSETTDLLERARAELVEGDTSFYETAREAWRACRCAELALLVETLAQTHGQPPIDEDKAKAWHAAWIARVREANPLDLPGLLSGLVDRAKAQHASMIASCLEELARYPDDPQLLAPLLQILAVEAASSAWNKVHTRIFQLLDAANDPRAIDALAPAIERAAVPSPTWSDSMRESLGRATKVRDKLRERFPGGVPAAPAGITGAIAAITNAKPSKPLVHVVRVDELDTLFAAVLDDPDDDARRAVYADALQQRGDLRGEIIALQLANTDAANKKAATLIGKHRKTLLGAIVKTVIVDTAVFEKGFLVACETDVRRATEADVIFGRAEWATVKRLRFRSYGALTPALRSLEEAYGVPESALAALRSLVLPRLRVLEIHPGASRGASASLSGGKPRGALAALADTTGLPALRELRINHLGAYEYDRYERRARTATDFAWALDAPCAAKLERIAVPWDHEDPEALRTWLEVLLARRALQVVEVPMGNSNLVIEKRGTELSATHRGVVGELPYVRAALGTIALTITPPEVTR